MRNNERRESCETFFNVGKICQKMHFALAEGCSFDDDDDNDDHDHDGNDDGDGDDNDDNDDVDDDDDDMLATGRKKHQIKALVVQEKDR